MYSKNQLRPRNLITNLRMNSKLIKVIALLVLVIYGLNLKGQVRQCGTMTGLANRLATDSKYAAFYEDAMSIPKVDPSLARIACDGTNSIVVPIAFHFANNAVTGNCEGVDCLLTEVQDQLDALNIAFGNNVAASATMVAACPAAYEDGAGNSVISTGTCVSFCLAIPPDGNAQGLDPACDPPITIGSFTGGLNGGGNGAPGWGGILNIFITNGNCLGVSDGIPGAGNGDGVTVCSQAFGGFDGPTGCNLDDDGTYNLGATLIHEIGHYLGLYHTFQGGCGDEPNGPGPFNVDDTPPASAPYYGCNSTTCQASGCGGGVQAIANFMDYTDDACMTMFTEDQAAVMNYWSNQLFGTSASQCSDPNPTELTSVCVMESCVVACATTVDNPLDITEELCAISTSTYTLPTDFSGLGLDDDSDATYTWTTGSYLPGGTVVAGPDYTLPATTTCAPAAVTLYLNVGCGIDESVNLQGGTVDLTIYPDPTQFAVEDLVTFTDGGCNGPTFVIVAGCESFVSVTQTSAQTFPVATGTGTVTYDVSLNYPTECCCTPTLCTVTVDNNTTVAIPDNGGPGNQACSSVTITCDGPITDVNVSLDVTHTYVGDLIITLVSPAGTVLTLGNLPGGGSCAGNDLAVTFDDAATNTSVAYEGSCANAPAISGVFQPASPLSGLNGEGGSGTWQVCVSDNAGVDTGTINSISVTVETEEPCTEPVLCTLMGSAEFVCSDDCTDCEDPLCVTVQTCDDLDCNTEMDMETVLTINGTICVPCAGTAVTPPSCDDGDCNTADSYDSVNCVCINDPITPPNCDDSDCNTEDSYDSVNCVCINDPITPPNCDDGDCNTADVFDTMTCLCENNPITPDACDDSDCSTADSYDNVNCVCINDPITPPNCDDGDCTTADSYDSVNCVCVNDPITPPSCDDGDCSTADSYDSVNCVCINDPITPPNCDDGDCTTADSYDSVNCVCINDPIAPPSCDDGDDCTIDIYNTSICLCENELDIACVDCEYAAANDIDICEFIAEHQGEGALLDGLDCDMGGELNSAECVRGGDPLNFADDVTCEVMNFVLSGFVCNADNSEVTVSVSWTGSDTSVSISDPNAIQGGDDPAVDVNGTATFTYASPGSWNIMITDIDGECIITDILGGPFDCENPCNAGHGNIQIKAVSGQ